MSDLYNDLDRLIQTRRATDAEVIENLVDRFYDDLYRLAVTILCDPDEAEDAVQESLITAMMRLDRYQPGTNLRAWLYTITLNTCRGYLRKRSRRFSLSTLLGRLFEQQERPPCPEKAALKNEGNAQLWDAVNDLGEKHRLPILLRYIEDLSTREIAQILGINEGTVRSRLHYGCRKLQERLSFVEGRIEEQGR